MTERDELSTILHHASQLFIGGEWVQPSSTAMVEVVDSTTEEVFLSVAEAMESDIARAVGAARAAFDSGPWPRMTPAERAGYMREFSALLRARTVGLGRIWPREFGVLYAMAKNMAADAGGAFEYYAGLADSYPFEEPARPSTGQYGVVVREPVGVVGAIIPWNGPLVLMGYKLAPALLAGCCVVVKCALESPAAGYVVAETAEAVGLPPGVINVVTADREASESLVRDSRVDKITFTGSTLAGRRIASLCGERIARCTLELGGKSAAVIFDDFDITTAAERLASAECLMTGQVCSSLTRIVVKRSRHDEMLEALASAFSKVRVGDPFDAESQMGPLVSARHRDRVESYIARGKDEGATLATGGGRPAHLDKGYFVEPTVFGNVNNSLAIAQEEIFGPVLSVIAADDEEHAIEIANDTMYGLNASVFTNDTDRARDAALRLRSGRVGHNAWTRSEFGFPSGGFKQSGLGREGGIDGLLAFQETKTVILDGVPSSLRT